MGGRHQTLYAHTQNRADEPGEIGIVNCTHISFHGFDGQMLYREAWNHGGGWVKRHEPPDSGGMGGHDFL